MAAVRDPGVLEFDAVIEVAGPGGAFVAIPFDVRAVFGVAGRVPVMATFDGMTYRGSLAKYGDRHVLGVRKDIRARIGKKPGDTVAVRLHVDTAPRVVDLPGEVTEALETAGRLAAFRALSYSHQRQYAAWLSEAKRADTRARRMASLIAKLPG
jgi:hypothetical protein